MAHIIVVGNEKGGAGKSTVSMHVSTALSRMGHKVSCLDLDLRQKSFTRYFENRLKYNKDAGFTLATPEMHALPEIPQEELQPGKTSMIIACRPPWRRQNPTATSSSSTAPARIRGSARWRIRWGTR